MRTLRTLGALLSIIVLLVGVPMALALLGSPTYLWQVDWRTALVVAADSRLVTALLSLTGWLAWGVIALTIVFEMVAVLTRQRIRLVVPGFGWLRPMAGALVVTALAMPSLASAEPGRPPTPAPAPTAPSESPPHDADSYVVRDGDELWDIAERELGAGQRWHEIAALNQGVDETSRLSAGQRLRLPRRSTPPQPDVVIVQPGESLWSIAERELGDGERWPEIYRRNHSQIADPDEIDAGWRLRIPRARTSPGAVPVRIPNPPPKVIVLPSPEEPGQIIETPQAHEDASQEARQETGEKTTHSADPGPLIGPIGSMLAAAILLGIGTRRRAQMLNRAVGRRLPAIPPAVARFWTALAQKSEGAELPGSAPSPTTVVLGWDEADEPVTVDVEPSRAVVFTGPGAEDAVAAAVTGLACAPWSDSVHMIIDDGTWTAALDEPRFEAEPDAAEAVARLTRLCSERQLALREAALADVRQEPDSAEAWAPIVFVFTRPLTSTQFAVLDEALSLGETGISVLACGTDAPRIHATHVELDDGLARLGARTFSPQLVPRPARRALLDLLTTTGRLDTDPAPWWNDELAPDSAPLAPADLSQQTAHGFLRTPQPPILMLLGEVGLVGAAGPPPSRATGQCLEYCAWLLTHPGAPPSEMTQDLMIADSTRRSNMSRLRAWLGHAPDGLAYLPDAYSGRIRLDTRVTSDWEAFTSLLSGGLGHATDSALREALLIVRGDPLGTFAFQWHWAEELRADMVAMIVDAACVLADRALDRDDHASALWAVSRGRLAAPEDDALSVREIQALALAGRRSEVDEAVLALNRNLRSLSRDLAADDALRIQSAIELARHSPPQPPTPV